MDKYTKMRFSTWCNKLDPEDPDYNRTIVYEFKTREGNTLYMTSEDTDMSTQMVERLYNAWIEEIESVKNELSDHWLIKLYED